MSRPSFNPVSALTGFAIGAVVTMLATVSILPETSVTNLSSGQGQFLSDPGPLAEGERVVTGEDGQVSVVDQSGRTVRTLASGGRAGTEGRFVGGTDGRVGSSGGGSAGSAGSGATAGTKGGSGSTGKGGTKGGSGAGTSGGGTQGGSGAGTSGGSAGGGSGTGTSGGGTGSNRVTSNPDGSPIECKAGKNGGATSTGVTGSEIKLGATVAESGIAQSFLGEVRQGMEAVKNKTNNAGGICGRSLKIEYKDDGWSADTGVRFIQNLVEGSKVFALAVSPSSEGVNSASSQNPSYFVKTGVPVVGSDGLIRSQYKDPMIYPVAASTTTVMHVIMKDAWDRGARKPAIVYENTYRFGVEGAFAFNQAYKRLSGKDIDGYSNPLEGGAATCTSHFCGIAADQKQYGNESSAFKNACGNPHTIGGTLHWDDESKACNFVAVLLEPTTAIDWMSAGGALTNRLVPKGLGAAQPLFTYDFGNACGAQCDQMRVWTGYNPTVGAYANAAAVKQFVADLHGQSATADEFNQFTEGGYLGMKLLVEGLKRAGPNLTRGALTAALDSMPAFDTGLSPPLTWRPGAHFANGAAQAFTMLSANGFGGWQQATGYINDPWLGQDIG